MDTCWTKYTNSPVENWSYISYTTKSTGTRIQLSVSKRWEVRTVNSKLYLTPKKTAENKSIPMSILINIETSKKCLPCRKNVKLLNMGKLNQYSQSCLGWYKRKTLKFKATCQTKGTRLHSVHWNLTKISEARVASKIPHIYSPTVWLE
jgi:hypothetical protein